MKFLLRFLLLFFLFSLNVYAINQLTDHRGVTFKVGQRVRVLKNYGGHKPLGVGIIDIIWGVQGGHGTAKVRFQDGKWSVYDFHALELPRRPGQK